MIWKLIGLISIVVAYMVSVLFSSLDILHTTTLHDSSSCRKLFYKDYAEDTIAFEDHIIAGASDFITLYFKHLSASSAAPGKLLAINPQTNKISQIKIEDFPNQYNFNPLALKIINKNHLYVLSHSYKKGGGLLFVIELSKSNETIEGKFLKVIHLGNEYGIYNSIAIVDENNFYMTRYLPFPDSEEGRDHSFLASFKRTLYTNFIRTNTVLYCKVNGDNAICEDKYVGYMPNGMVLSKNLLFVADTATKSVEIFEVQKNFDIVKKFSIEISHRTDNLQFHNGKVYVTGCSKLIDVVKCAQNVKDNEKPYHVAPGGVSVVYEEGGKWNTKEIIMQDMLNFPTQSTIVDNQIVFSSMVDDSLLICPFNN